jgi:hypothetical protein
MKQQKLEQKRRTGSAGLYNRQLQDRVYAKRKGGTGPFSLASRDISESNMYVSSLRRASKKKNANMEQK